LNYLLIPPCGAIGAAIATSTSYLPYVILNWLEVRKSLRESIKSITMTFVSVIIPTYKDWNRLKLCIDALIKQTYPQDQFEVIVVNNGHGDSCPFELLAANIKIIEEAKPGSYAARNAGIRIAKGEILAFTDSDCIPDRDWLKNAIAEFDKHPDLDRIAGAVNIFPIKENPSYINKYESMYAIRQDKYAALGKAATANFLVRAKLFNTVGLFIDSVFSGEDHEWNLRASDLGFTIAYGNDCIVSHPARNKRQILSKTKRLLPRHIQKNAPHASWLTLWIYGLFLIRPPFKYFRELFKSRITHKITFAEVIQIWLLLYRMRFVRFKKHYSLLFGGKKTRI
jgi:glycosyltransferase involved in cell wall biosynthesis